MTINNSQYVFEIARDLIETLTNLEVGEDIKIHISKKDIGLFDIESNKDWSTGSREVSGDIGAAYNEAMKRVYHERS